MQTVSGRDLRRSGSIMAEERCSVSERDLRRSGSIMAEEPCRL